MSVHSYLFDKEFENCTKQSAKKIMSLLFDSLGIIDFTSAVDLGAGTGRWLKEFSKHAIATQKKKRISFPVNIFALEDPRSGPIDFDNRKKSGISSKVKYFDLEKDLPKIPKLVDKNKGKFSLAICLEVAEHLSEFYADDLVNVLTQLSDVVLFSAAYPGQEGVGHINCQFPSYWAKKFEAAEFHPFDFIRSRLWDTIEHNDVHWWYIQNTLVFINMETAGDNFLYEIDSRAVTCKNDFKYLDIVHPLFCKFLLRGNADATERDFLRIPY
jgi:hypothetical protein